MNLLNSLAYAGDVVLTAATYGAFRSGHSKGLHEAETKTNEAQGLTIEAQAARIDILEKERTELTNRVNELTIKLDYLEELVLRGTSQVVQARPVANQRG